MSDNTVVLELSIVIFGYDLTLVKLFRSRGCIEQILKIVSDNRHRPRIGTTPDSKQVHCSKLESHYMR